MLLISTLLGLRKSAFAGAVYSLIGISMFLFFIRLSLISCLSTSTIEKNKYMNMLRSYITVLSCQIYINASSTQLGNTVWRQHSMGDTAQQYSLATGCYEQHSLAIARVLDHRGNMWAANITKKWSKNRRTTIRGKKIVKRRLSIQKKVGNRLYYISLNELHQ